MTKNKLTHLLLCLSFSLWHSSATASNFEALSHIKTTAEQFALAQVNDQKLSNIEAHAITMDTRLKLEKCELPLQAFATTNSRNMTRTTIGIRCNGNKPWSLYVPVTINALVDVVYTTKPKGRGELLSSEDIEIKQLPLNQLPANYLSESEQLNGMELTRSVKSGSVLTLNALKVRQIVQRGQEVVILAKGNNVQVRMSGIALGNGNSGDTISIRNIKSGRTIEATVLNASTVIVNM